MSYNLAVFEPRDELRTRAKFDTWYDEATELKQDFDYNNLENAYGTLRAWLLEMIQTFPQTNGPLALKGEKNWRGDRCAEYWIGSDLIYVAFSWYDIDLAYEMCIRIAEKHPVALLDASGNERAAWFPNAHGKLEIAHVDGDE